MILLTGGNGFLGKIIVKKLIRNCGLICLSRTATDYKISLEREIPSFNHKFDLVIHAAGKAHSIPKTVIEKQQFHDINVLGAQNLLKGLEKSGIPKQFIFISSVSVYGQELGTDISEEHPLEAIDAYGLSKIEAEKTIKEWCEKYNVICTILRLPLLVGENPPGNLGSMLKAIKKGYYFNVGGGKAKKSMVLAEDVARFIPIIAPIGGIYNITDGVHPTFKELSSAITKKEVFNLNLNLAKVFGLIGDLIGNKSPLNSLKIKKITSDLTFDDSKARKMGWNPKSVLEYLKNNNL
ncbi:MAG: NAD-dependent epimerase/dehydratase family protein [Flavobacterium sp.]